MTVAELAEKHKVSPRTVKRWRKQGDIRAVDGDIKPAVSPQKSDIPPKGDISSYGVTLMGVKPDSRFNENGGRGVIRQGMVRVSFDPSDPDKDRMVSEEGWRAHMKFKCVKHGRFGWSCTTCLNDPVAIWQEGVHIR